MAAGPHMKGITPMNRLVKHTRPVTSAAILLAATVAEVGTFAAEPFVHVFSASDTNSTPEIFPQLAVFRESIRSFPVSGGVDGKRLTPLSKALTYPKEYVRRIPESQRRLTPYRFDEIFANPEATVNSEYVRSGRPFFVYERVSRPPFFLPRDGCPLARRDSYAEWLKRSPGFIGFNSLWELDSDSNYFERFYNNMKDPSIEAELHAAFGPPDENGRAHRRRWAEKVFRIAEDFHFGERRIYPMCSGNMGYEHIFGALGAAGLWYEATTQSAGPWNAAGAFVRGAARQRGLDFGWYMAQYYVGMNRKGEPLKGDSCWCRGPSGTDRPRPHRGESRSMHRRQIVYGWLIGAKYMQTEGWTKIYVDEKDGRLVPSENALDLNEIYELSKRTERGETFTPLAVLTPLDEPCATTYINPKFVEPDTQKDIFDTLVPFRSEYGRPRAYRGKGEQGCLFNSEFAGFFDVLCPDSGQDTAAFAKALSRYRHVLIAGNAFDKARFDSAAIEAFERSGGRVHRYPSPECDTPERLRSLLLKIQSETMPISVEGDIQWGVNRTSAGWLVWLINNKGVIKFCDEPEEFNMARTAHVTVCVKSTGECRTADIKPGDFCLMEIRK